MMRSTVHPPLQYLQIPKQQLKVRWIERISKSWDDIFLDSIFAA
jgi:hypothetical protein